MFKYISNDIAFEMTIVKVISNKVMYIVKEFNPYWFLPVHVFMIPFRPTDSYQHFNKGYFKHG